MPDGLRVFISYARRDASVFADELQTALEVAGFEAFLDRHDIAAGEDWEARLGGLIHSADTIVYVVTPASVTSDRCRWEIARASEASKRVIPVVAVDVSEEQTPGELKRLNYIFFSEGHSFAKSLSALATALRVDVDWIREHTRLAEAARRWGERNKPDVLLLRGSELEAARTWLSSWRSPAPEPTDLHRALIAASETAESAVVKQAQRRQRRVLVAVSAVAVVFAGLAIGAGLSWRRAVESEERMYDAQLSAERAAIEAASSEQAARMTAARASLYEGLYWLRTANDGGATRDGPQDRAWSNAKSSFDRGLRSLGSDDTSVDGESLRELLLYGQNFVLLCAGLSDLQGYSPAAGVREYYLRIRMPSCSSYDGSLRARPRPALE